MARRARPRPPAGRVALLISGVVAVALAVAASPTGTTGSAVAGTEGPPRPNVLIVLTDDQPPSTMGAMPQTTTWLGGEGTTYTNAIAPTPLCCPARASVLTGRYVHNHGVRTLDDAYQLDFSRTLPARLQTAGYRTAIAGKLMNSWRLGDQPPGFDRWAMLGGGYTRVPVHADDRTGVVSGDDGEPVETSQLDTMEDVAHAWLDDFEGETDDAPWLMYLAPTAPHTPYALQSGTAPPMPITAAHLEVGQADKPPHVRDLGRGLHTPTPPEPQWQAAYRTLPALDALLANLHNRLAELGELDNTLVVFSSDNGYHFGEQRLKGKREAYDASLRVPLHLSWPAGAPQLAGTVDRRIAGLTDIAATVYAAAGVEPGYVVDGQSLLAPATRKRILIEHFAGGSHAQNVPDWAGWWSPTGMFRQNVYADQGTPGCSDVDPATLCQRYAAMPGALELYDRPLQTQNLLQDGAGVGQHLSWTAAASTCAGQRCRELEAVAPVVTRRSVLRVTMTAPRGLLVGQVGTVTVTARNLSGRRLRDVTLDVTRQRSWRATAVTPTRFGSVAPGAAVRATFRVAFTGRGRVSLPATARHATGRLAWSARPIRVTRG